jgi:two-component system nitrate/nitrite response regulator NarL
MRHRPFATILVGPSALLRHGLARILDAENFRVIASDAHVQDVAPTPQHQTLLLVIDAGDEPSAALAEIALFKKQHPSGRVALLADNYVVGDMVSAFSAGANVCFAKSVSCDAFTKALELIMLGETILPPQLLAVIGSHRRDLDDSGTIIQKVQRSPSQPTDSTPPLSAREKCILRCMADGDSNKLIARKIDIAEATVKVHVKAILRKIRVHNRTQAAIWAMNNGASLWSSAPSPQPLADMSPPASSMPDVPMEPLQLPPPKDHCNHAKAPSLTSITSVMRKSVARRTQA